MALPILLCYTVYHEQCIPNPLYFVHDGLEDSILGRPLQCYKSITVDDKEEKKNGRGAKLSLLIKHTKNTNCPN